MGVYGQLLDTPQLTLGDTRYDPPLSKATVLLYYLAYKGDWCSRDELLYVFYPDTAENTARSNLRQLLTSIRRLPYGQGLSVEAGRPGLSPPMCKPSGRLCARGSGDKPLGSTRESC